jgi:hypothetical protein
MTTPASACSSRVKKATPGVVITPAERHSPDDKFRLFAVFPHLPRQRSTDDFNGLFIERKFSGFAAHSIRTKKFFHNSFSKYCK